MEWIAHHCQYGILFSVPKSTMPLCTVYTVQCTYIHINIYYYYLNRCHCWFDTHIWCSNNNSVSMTSSIFNENYSIVILFHFVCVYTNTLMCHVVPLTPHETTFFIQHRFTCSWKLYYSRLYKICSPYTLSRDKNHIILLLFAVCPISFSKLTSMDRLFRLFLYGNGAIRKWLRKYKITWIKRWFKWKDNKNQDVLKVNSNRQMIIYKLTYKQTKREFEWYKITCIEPFYFFYFDTK